MVGDVKLLKTENGIHASIGAVLVRAEIRLIYGF